MSLPLCAVPLGMALIVAPPDAPPVAPPEAPDTPNAAALAPAAAEPAPEADDAPLPTDERGDPILDYSPDGDPGTRLDFAEQTPPPETASLEYAEDANDDPGLEYQAEDRRSPPAPQAVERQSKVRLGAKGDPRSDPDYSSPQRFAIELKMGPYLPSVDDRYEGEGFGPYAEVFGETNRRGEANADPRKGLMAKLGFEWQFYNFGGPFLLGTSVGFFQDRADALVASPAADANTVRSSADRVRFNVVPLSLDLGYRFELLADEYKVPLVPYVKGGLAYGIWWSKSGGKKITRNDAGEQGRGGSIGWQASLGMMLRLDFLERGTARDLDRNTGINHTYLFGEYQFQRLDGFGGALEKLSVGDDTFYVGFAIEF